MTPDSDEALFARLVAGDLAAFDALYTRFARPLGGFARAYTGSAAEAEELVHEAFTTVLRQRRAPDGVRSFRAWLYTVARNLCLNHARSRRRADHARGAIQRVPDAPPPDAEQQLMQRERAARLVRAVAALPAELAEVYRLRGSGLSYDEVAAVLAVPVGTVKWRIHALVQQLKAEVEP